MQTSLTSAKISGVIVSYNPDIDALRHLVAAVAPQLDQLFIIDNGSNFNVGSSIDHSMCTAIIELGDNYGIARAQNIGIERARSSGSNFVLLLDQDSIPASDMVAKLLAAVFAKQEQGYQVACVGPHYTDSRQRDTAPFIRLEGLKLKRQMCPASNTLIDVDFLIASGCLIPMPTIDAVGMMVEDMFIDYVDIEWGLRAQQMGYRSYGVCAATMVHALGDESIAFGTRHVPVHSPLRHYYHIRNAIWLCRQKWIPSQWKFVLMWRVARQFAFFSLMTSPRLEHAKMMALGLLHGMVNRMGRR